MNTPLSKSVTFWAKVSVGRAFCLSGGIFAEGSRNTAFARKSRFLLTPYIFQIEGCQERCQCPFFFISNTFHYLLYIFTPFLCKLYIREGKRGKIGKYKEKNSIYIKIGESVVRKSGKKGMERRPAR
jgi:hypothetical protein